MMTRLYFSREERVGEINDESNRVQYDSLENDLERIHEAWDALEEYVDQLGGAYEEYIEAMQEDGEDGPSRMGYARRDFIEKWSLTQATLSKLAWVMRIDGNEAYQRMMNALKSGNAVDMSGL